MKNPPEKSVKNNFALNRWLPVFIWASIIFFFSSLPQQKVGETFISDFIVKKIAHITEYAILYFLTFRATNKNYLYSYVFVMSYAILDEIHQSFVPGRSPKIYDVLGFDFTGANIAAFVLWKLKRTQLDRPKK